MEMIDVNLKGVTCMLKRVIHDGKEQWILVTDGKNIKKKLLEDLGFGKKADECYSMDIEEELALELMSKEYYYSRISKDKEGNFIFKYSNCMENGGPWVTVKYGEGTWFYERLNSKSISDTYGSFKECMDMAFKDMVRSSRY